MPQPAKTMAKATAAQRKLQRRVAGIREVNGIGITRVDEGFCLKLNLSAQVRGTALPDEIDGIPVRVEVVGPIRARKPA